MGYGGVGVARCGEGRIGKVERRVDIHCICSFGRPSASASTLM